jgi:hypothetical protein
MYVANAQSDTVSVINLCWYIYRDRISLRHLSRQQHFFFLFLYKCWYYYSYIPKVVTI